MSNLYDYQTFLKNSDKTVKGENLSTYDKRKNLALYQQYVREQNAERTKNTLLETAEKEKNKALRENNIAQERAKKYLNAIATQNGIAKTGYIEGKAIDLYAQEASRRASINDAYNTQKNTALEAYQTAIADANAKTSEEVSTIELDEQAYNEQKKETDRQTVLNQLASNLELYNNGTIDYDTYAEYFNQNKNKLDATLDRTVINTYQKEINKQTTQRNTIDHLQEKYGFTPQKIVSVDEMNEGNPFDVGINDEGQKNYIAKIIAKIKSGELNGKVVDVDAGTGYHYYYCKDGYMYEVPNSKIYEVLDIADLEALNLKETLNRM